jgi:hypothetical protein
MFQDFSLGIECLIGRWRDSNVSQIRRKNQRRNRVRRLGNNCEIRAPLETSDADFLSSIAQRRTVPPLKNALCDRPRPSSLLLIPQSYSYSYSNSVFDRRWLTGVCAEKRHRNEGNERMHLPTAKRLRTRTTTRTRTIRRRKIKKARE